MEADHQHRQNTNPYNSGGGGFDVEDRYAAWCLACWLSGVQPPGCVVPASLVLTDIAWQAPKENWLFDDLILTFEGKGVRKQFGVSIKSGDYLKGGLPPKDLVNDIWRQALGEGVRALADSNDLIVAVPSLAPEHAKDWHEVGDWARAQTDEALEANIAKANVGNDFKRSLVSALKCPEELTTGRSAADLRVGRILRRLRLVDHDYRSPSDSRLVEEGIKRCSEVLVDGSRTNAESLWNHLQRIAEKMRPNAGQLTFPQLLEHIRKEHRLVVHPDDAASWALVDVETARRLDRIADSIGGLKLDRKPAVQKLRAALDAGSLVAFLAESGEGKTVCAKRLADTLKAEKHRVVWLEPDQMCNPDGPGRKLGLDRPLDALIQRAVESDAFLFADQVDQYDNQGLMNLFSLLRHLSSWRVVLTATPEGWRRIEQRVLKAIEQRGSAQLVHLPELDHSEVQAIGEKHPNLGRILEDHRLRRVVLRPRVLDLIAQEAVTHATASQWVCEADVIDWFFDSLVERNRGDGRRSTTVRLAAELADSYSASMPEDEVDPADADRIASLHTDRVLRVQDGRVGFDHPLLADWSKRQFLVAREPQIANDLNIHARMDNPAWQRAVRLYGLRLIEQRKDVQSFVSLLKTLEPAGKPVSCGDSLLATVVTATDPSAVLDTLWPIIQTDEDLLQRLLRVNHFAGTVPHPKMQNEHLRLPISWHYPLLVLWLHAKQTEVIRLAPAEVAIIAETWLRTAGQLSEIPARSEAAELALALANAARNDSSGERFPFDAKQPVYWALLAAVLVDPANALDLLRKLAERIENDPSQQNDVELPTVTDFIGGSGNNSSPSSPDAPCRAVDHSFREVCHDWIALEPLMLHSPEAAAEVILATLLRPTDSLRYGYHGIDRLDDAAASDPSWSPAMWWHGPFGRLLRINERVGIDLILRLVNYITEVWQHDAEHSAYRDEGPVPYMEIEVDGDFRRWLGGGLGADNVFSWHSIGHRCPRSVQCALMALEHYFYEAESDKRQIDTAIEQILKGSRSAAFAGLLAAVANHRPQLLDGSLQPLLTCAQAVWHDELRRTNREDRACAGIGLPLQPQFVQKQVTTWYCMKHRDKSLIMPLMWFAVQKNPLALFDRVRARLNARIANGEVGDEKCPNQLLAAWYDPANWRKVNTANGFQIEFVRPPHLQASDADIRKMQQDRDVLFLPMRARTLIDEGKPPDDNGMEELWTRFDELAADWKDKGVERGVANAVTGIAAAAIVLRPDWLRQSSGRYDKAVQLIDAIAASPPAPSGYDSADQGFSQGWDTFHADVSGTLYAREPENPLCRERVVTAVTGYHYAVVGHVMRAVVNARTSGARLSLGPLLNLIIQWAALREACHLDAKIHKRGERELQAIAETFLEGTEEQLLQPWSSAADRYKSVLCEGTIIQVVNATPRPSVGDSFFGEPAWPLVVEQGISWLLRVSRAAIKGDDEDDEGDEQDLDFAVGHDLESAIVRLAAESVVHAPSDPWANNIVSQCLALPCKRLGARENFASWFASYAMGGVNDELPAKAVVRWTLFAKAVLDLDESNSEADDLPKAALGLRYLSQYSWIQNATPAAIALVPYFERWIKSARRDVQDAVGFAYFLTRPAAESLQLNGIEWLASNQKFTEPHRWRDESDRQPLVSLLEQIIRSIPFGQQSPSFRIAIVKLLSVLSAAGDGRAADLQRSFGTLS